MICFNNCSCLRELICQVYYLAGLVRHDLKAMANAKTFWPNSLEARELDRLEDILYLAMDPSCVIMNPRVNDGSPLAFPYMALNLLEKYFQEEAKRVEKYLLSLIHI